MMSTCKEKSSLSPFMFILILLFLFNGNLFSATGTTGVNGSTANWKDNVSETELAQQIQGEGLIITNPSLSRGNGGQVGTFSNGKSGAKLEIDEGILLTAMSVEESFTTNSSQRTSINNPDITPDDDLLAIDNRARYDTVVFTFDVTLKEHTRLLLIEFQFASEEYNEYVGSVFNDTFGFFLSGGDLNQTYNIARVVDSSVKMTTETIQSYPAVTVNNVNNGNIGEQEDGTPWDSNNTSYFIDNVGNNSASTPPAITPIDVEYDGITHKLQAAVDNLTPGVTYHFKMALSDTGDSQWDTGVFVNKIVGIREPSLCYDYSYQQNKKYFTEFNDGSNLPHIQGSILENDDINTTIYIRNEEDSDVLAYNITMDITDINVTNDSNITQAIYKPESTYIVNTGEVLPIHIPDSSMVTSDANITEIPVNDLKGKSYVYLYYGITPQSGITEINIPLNAKISYTVQFDIGGGNTITQDYNTSLGADGIFIDGKDSIPLCAGDNTKYEVDWGIFNVVSKGVHNSNSQKYNIPTQVAGRPQEMVVTAHDESNNYTDEINSTILVGVDLIDAGKFHSVKASCDEPTSAMSPIVWMAFRNSKTIDLKQEITNAINDDRLTMNSVNDYYSEARQNAAYRISYITTNDANESLVDTSQGTGGADYLKLNNFTELVQDIGTCKQPVRKFADKDLTTTLVPVACANAGNKGLSPFEYQRCMECLFGYNTSHICSRDNFAIRPESFNIQIKDLNQTNKTQKSSFATDRTGVSSPNTSKVNIASGYAYEFDINATNHNDNNKVSGYTRYFTTSSTDHNITFVWSSDKNSTVCNDVSSKPLAFNMVNGTVSGEANASNVGEYKLNMIDKGWTAVDWEPNKQIHHGGANSIYFVQGTDCIQDNSIAQNNGVLPSISGASLINTNGCDINTDNHNNSDANLKYRDYNITVKPYKFDIPNFVPNTFRYMSDVDNNASSIMAVQYNGNIQARGFDNSIPSNYVANCYADDLNISFQGNIELSDNIPYRVRFIDYNSSNIAIADFSRDINNSINNNFDDLNLSSTFFRKDNNGVMDINVSINYDRNLTIPVNPQIVQYRRVDVNCSVASDCQINADLKNDFNITGSDNFTDVNITHYYGRVHAPDYRFEITTAQPFATADILYEVYCDGCNQALYGVSNTESPDSINWYLNTDHNLTTDGRVPFDTSVAGNVTTTITNLITPISQGLENRRFTSTSNPVAPNKDRIQMTPDPWLLYNRFNNNATTNDFDVEFYSATGNWAGEGTIGNTVDVNISTIQNRRLDW